MSQGFIFLYRELADKAIWKGSSPEQRSILIVILLSANHEKNQWEWQGEKFDVNPGQFITSLDKLAKKAGKGVSVRNVRTALERFEKLGFLANKSTKTGRLITVLNWNSYQNPERTTRQSNRQSPDKDLTTNNNETMKQELYKLIFDHWNAQKIVIHRKLSTKDIPAINWALKDFTQDSILKAITNYSGVLKSPEHYFKHKWPLRDFLQRGLRKFVDESDPWSNFKKGNHRGSNDEKTEQQLKELD